MSSKIIKDTTLNYVTPYVLLDVTPELMADTFDVLEKVGLGEERLSDIERMAYEQGFHAGETAGMEAGLESARKEADSLIKTASCLIEKLEGTRQEITERSQKEILKLSLAIARKVVHAEITVNKEVIVSILKAAVKKLAVKDSVKVRLNPMDAEYISGRKPEFLTAMDGVKEMAIEEDPLVPRGGCVVEAGLAEVDARLEKQLEEITAALLKGAEGNE